MSTSISRAWRQTGLVVAVAALGWACASGSEVNLSGAGGGDAVVGVGASGGGDTSIDADEDGYPADEDCDDDNPDVHPGAEETCDGVDDNCSGDELDASDTLTWFEDKDGDGFGISGVTTDACEQPDGYADQPNDCNDDDADFYPGAPETDCSDPNDYNCDGSVGFVDADGDGFAACEECNDGNNDVFPGADELCNGEDDDCNGVADAVGGEDDIDGDGSFSCEDCDDDDENNFPGNPEKCDGQDNDCNNVADFPGGEIDNDSDGSFSCADCDDNNPNNFPGNTEKCDGFDNNCNGLADMVGGEGNFDGDPALACADCDDTDPGRYPGNIEACDGKDNDCNGVADAPGGEGNADGDPALACNDCDDMNPNRYPGKPELCNGYDDDCNSATADGSQQAGYGQPCDGPDTDLCNEGTNNCVAGVWCSDNTGNNIEICDNIDNDCNPATVDGSQQAGYGLPCDGGDGDLCLEGFNTCVNGVFCSDTTPTNVEVCNTIDEDCDGNINEGPCSLLNASSTCSGGGCIITDCNTGFCNLDNVASTGCEYDLDTNPACPTNAVNLGTVSGDTSSPNLSVTTRGERYFRVYVAENDSGFCSTEDLCVEIELNPNGAAMDYDLYARCDGCATGSTYSAASTQLSGVTDTVRLRWDEDEVFGCPTGSNSGRDVYIWVQMYSVDECNNYTLTVRGDVCPTSNTCGSK